MNKKTSSAYTERGMSTESAKNWQYFCLGLTMNIDIKREGI